MRQTLGSPVLAPTAGKRTGNWSGEEGGRGRGPKRGRREEVLDQECGQRSAKGTGEGVALSGRS